MAADLSRVGKGNTLWFSGIEQVQSTGHGGIQHTYHAGISLAVAETKPLVQIGRGRKAYSNIRSVEIFMLLLHEVDKMTYRREIP